MIRTNPTFIEADEMGIKEYCNHIFNGNHFIYSSIWKWWKKTTLFSCIFLSIASIVLLAAILYQELTLRDSTDWGLVISVSFIPLIFSLPLIWFGSYYYSFIKSRKIKKNILEFISTYIPDATNITRMSATNYAISRDGIDFEILYTTIPENNSKGKTIRNYNCIFICLYYKLKAGKEELWLDKYGHLSENLFNEFYAYCQGKESCSHLALEGYGILSMYNLKYKPQRSDEVLRTLEQMSYLLDKLSLSPLFLSDSIYKNIINWLNRIDNPTPEDIIAINIGLSQTETGYGIHITGARNYDENNNYWACNEDFVPNENYLDIPITNEEYRDWRKFQKRVVDIATDYVKDKGKADSSIFYNKKVTVGFDDGDLVRIK